jgi:hypothetical protein
MASFSSSVAEGTGQRRAARRPRALAQETPIPRTPAVVAKK